MSQDASPSGGAPGWRASLVAVCISQATAIVGFDFTLPFVPLFLQRELGVHGLGQTALWAGLIGFGPAIPATIMGPFWGKVADRVGYRFMLLRAVICAALLLSLMALAPSPGVLLALRMIQGSLTGTIFASQALVAASVPQKETGRAMGLLQMSVSLGATLGPIGGGAVADTLGFRAAFVAAGILLATSAAIVFFFVREPERKKLPREAAERRPSLLSVLAIPAFAGALLLTLVVQLASTAMFPIIPLFVQELLHSTSNVASDTGWLFALSGVASAAGAYTAGRLQRRLGLTRMLFACVVLSAALLVPQAFAGSFAFFLCTRAVAQFSFGCLFGLVGTWAALSSPPDAKGAAFGLMGAASSLGFGTGPLLGGALAALVGIRPIFIISALMLGSVPVMLAAASALRSAFRPVARVRALAVDQEM
jgi:DHA1 family multidrug resistance protein-like MFS transporter